MTDPADMDGAALGEAVGLALGWATETNENTGVRYWRRCDANPRPNGHWRSEDMRAPLDFTSRGKWAAFGELLAECERRDIHLELDMPAGYLKLGDLRLHEGEGGYELGSEAVHGADDIPRALAVAYLRAVAGEGRA